MEALHVFEEGERCLPAALERPRMHALRLYDAHEGLGGRVVPGRGHGPHGRADAVVAHGLPQKQADILCAVVAMMYAASGGPPSGDGRPGRTVRELGGGPRPHGPALLNNTRRAAARPRHGRTFRRSCGPARATPSTCSSRSVGRPPRRTCRGGGGPSRPHARLGQDGCTGPWLPPDDAVFANTIVSGRHGPSCLLTVALALRIQGANLQERMQLLRLPLQCCVHIFD